MNIFDHIVKFRIERFTHNSSELENMGNSSNNEMAKAISNKNPNLSMPNTLLDLTKKRYI